MKQIIKFAGLILGLLCLTACKREKITVTTRPVQTAAESQEAVPETTAMPAGTLVQEPSLPLETVPEPENGDFVKISDYIPTVRQELFYSTDQNFTGQVVYGFQDAYLRYGTVKKLMAVSEDLAQMGLYLKVWDGFRPVSAQFQLWEIYPDPTYVANPNVGFSSHSRGNTVDLTLVDETGAELVMPTGFDDFSGKADRNYADCTEEEKNNAQILEILMEKHGFKGYYGEWWHYSDTESYPVEENFEPPVVETEP